MYPETNGSEWTTEGPEASGSGGGGSDFTDEQSENNEVIIEEKRKKRATSVDNTNSTTNNKTKTSLKKTNSASSVLGLNILLYQNLADYWNPPDWRGLVQNNYIGFKVILHI